MNLSAVDKRKSLEVKWSHARVSHQWCIIVSHAMGTLPGLITKLPSITYFGTSWKLNECILVNRLSVLIIVNKLVPVKRITLFFISSIFYFIL